MVSIFRDAYSSMAVNFPVLEIHFYYITHGSDIHPNVSGKVAKLEDDINVMFSDAVFGFDFIGARELVEISRREPSRVRSLEFSESTIQTDLGSYICLSSLDKYYRFISDSGALSRSVFEANVRDYQGSVIVNKAIKETLSNTSSEYFWYLNNGVTIITPKATSAGKTLTIEDPQIVNGLQTSYEIYNYFSQLEKQITDNRKVLVRVICDEDDEARERIIRATNSQTSIPPASLRSSDEIHRNIEDYLVSHGFFYDRKKNYYKNQGKPISKIIGIPYMAQAMMAIILQKPDSARARPSTLINSTATYERIFSNDISIDIYLKVILIMKSVENFLKPQKCPLELQRKDVTNIKFYVAALVGAQISGDNTSPIRGLGSKEDIIPSDELVHNMLTLAYEKYLALGGSDQVAKGPSLVKALGLG